jgi:hypothetical protein
MLTHVLGDGLRLTCEWAAPIFRYSRGCIFRYSLPLMPRPFSRRVIARHIHHPAALPAASFRGIAERANGHRIAARRLRQARQSQNGSQRGRMTIFSLAESKKAVTTVAAMAISNQQNL